MANIVNATDRYIEVSLDGVTDFDVITDLAGLGLARNAPNGLRVRRIVAIPSALNDTVIVRDTMNGPQLLPAIDMLGTWDILQVELREDGRARDRGQMVTPYIHANETVVGVVNELYVVFHI